MNFKKTIDMKMLDMQDQKIIKQINIISKTPHGTDTVIGLAVYDREINNNYKYQDGTTENRISKLINYPKQEHFPSDAVDQMILNSIKEIYPNSFITNYHLIWDNDIERIKHFLDRPKEEAFLEVRPDFSQIDLKTLLGKNIDIFRRKINIYQNYSLDSI
ncbi:MAG: hypothetical protein EOO44_21695, partial [Flavobacterium sp.]